MTYSRDLCIDGLIKRRYVFVDTFDFQAPEFYLKHGYKQVFELSEYPKTGKRHYIYGESEFAGELPL